MSQLPSRRLLFCVCCFRQSHLPIRMLGATSESNPVNDARRVVPTMRVSVGIVLEPIAPFLFHLRKRASDDPCGHEKFSLCYRLFELFFRVVTSHDIIVIPFFNEKPKASEFFAADIVM